MQNLFSDRREEPNRREERQGCGAEYPSRRRRRGTGKDAAPRSVPQESFDCFRNAPRPAGEIFFVGMAATREGR